MKKIYRLIGMALALFLLGTRISLHAEVYDEAKFKKAYAYMEEKNKRWLNYKGIEAFSLETFQSYGLLVLKNDDPKSVKRNLTGGKTRANKLLEGQWRYLGYAPDGTTVNNPEYPIEVFPSKNIDYYKYIEIEQESIKGLGLLFKKDNRKDIITAQVFTGLKDKFKDKFTMPTKSNEKDKWLRRAEVLVMPTPYSRGIVRFNHTTGYFTVVLGEKPDPLPPEEDVKDPVTSEVGRDGRSSLILGSKEIGKEIFDTRRGIPTNEEIYISLIGPRYLGGYSYSQLSGGKDISVNVVGSLVSREKKYKTVKGKKIPDGYKEVTSPLNQTYTVRKTYSRNKIIDLYVYKIKEANIKNYAIPTGQRRLLPIESYKVSASYQEGELIAPPSNQTVNVGRVYSSNQGAAASRGAVGYKATNDIIIIDGVKTEAGQDLAPAKNIKEKTIYEANIGIEAGLKNKKDTGSQALLVYEKILDYNNNKPQNKTLKIEGNKLTVHTPVVCYPKTELASNEKKLKYTDIGLDDPVKILEESYDILYPTEGKHLEIKGYGERDYRKYTKKRQIRFTYPVYQGEGYGGKYLEENIWHDFEAKERQGYFIPAWAKEGDHYISFRTIPINLDDIKSKAWEKNANKNLDKYKAVTSFTVKLKGKISKSLITEVRDRRKYSDLDSPIYPQKGKKEDEGIRLGFPIDMIISTNGAMVTDKDYIKIIPTYYYVNRRTRARQEVDLYYHGHNKLVQINKDQTQIREKTNIKEHSGLKSDTYVKDTALVKHMDRIRPKYKEATYYKEIMTRGSVDIGHPGLIKLADEARLYTGGDIIRDYGVAESVDKKEVIKSKQDHYLRFFLPSETYAVAKGTDLNKKGSFSLKDPIFLKKGYILVKIDLEVYRNDVLYQKHTIENKLTTPEARKYKTNHGDSFYYDTDKRASQLLK